MKKWIIGTAVATLVAIPALAQMDHGQHHGMKERMMRAPETRGEVEAQVKAHFALVDTDKDGAITKAEADAFREKMRREMRDRMFDRIDSDKNGQISRAEFDAHHQNMGMRDGRRGKHGGHHGHHAMKGGMGLKGGMFERADANGDGKVTLAEAQSHALAKFDAADANKDGTLTPEERRDAWKARMDQRADRKADRKD